MKRYRGWITKDQLPRSPRADAVYADIIDRLQQHDDEDTLPRGGRGLFYDLRPHGFPAMSAASPTPTIRKSKGRATSTWKLLPLMFKNCCP